MILGFTGTQEGLSELQGLALVDLLWSLDFSAFHHGDCLGADSYADYVVRNKGLAVHIHPPVNPAKRAFCDRRGGTSVVYGLLPYLKRNQRIVEACDRLIACPKGPEELRSGTWSTVRYARRLAKPVTIVYPDGTIEGG